MSTTNSLSDSGPSLSGECSLNGNSHEGCNDDESSSYGSQDVVDSTPKEKSINRQYTLERKAKNMPSDILYENFKENGVKSVHFPFDREEDSAVMDASIWEPPGPEDQEEDIERGVADVEKDDDECCDGPRWGFSSAIGESKDECSRKRNSNEENRRAMLNMAHSKFKFSVSQVIKSARSSMEEGESWIEIVPRLCWEAVSLLKPAIDGKPIDPTEYIKVKCIATGSCSESEVFNGLVFNKHAALKHMATNYENPRIMLVQGVLGQPLSGFSSLPSMDRDFYVKPVVDIMEALKPDVVLVEKSVSRDIQLSILQQKATLVLDMNIYRLQRISRCIGSPLIPMESLLRQKLKHCDSFRIEKIAEEHNAVGGAKKNPTKTLMFLEGFHTGLGCTILLKGSHRDQLKKVKEVVKYSVVLAYHLILEASFLADRQTMFSTIFTKEASSCIAETEKCPLSPSPKAVDEQSIQINGGRDNENDTETTLESQSILVLVSKRNSLRGIMCDQRHLVRITFYNHFDVPLKNFLRDMLNQRSRCQTCGELPESHIYYYAHDNKQLTIQIKRISVPKCLSGGAKGKLWMWSRCGECKTKNGARKSTKRVLVSTAAMHMSFGKFLELSFTQHSLERDFLHFFGLGSMVAMLSYSQVTSYAVSLPPMVLEPRILIKVGSLEEEFLRVFTKGISLFEDAASFLKRLRSQFKNSDLSAPKFISHIEELLDHERCGYEENFKIAFNKAKTIEDLLGLNRMRWDLLLQAHIWNYRLQSLVLSDRLHEANKLIPDTKDSLLGEAAASNILGLGDEWFWQPFEDLRSKPVVQVEKEYLMKFEYVNNFTQENLPTANQIITEEGSRLRISLRDDDFIVSDYEDELSSLIACALAHLSNPDNRLERPAPSEVLVTFGSLKPKYSIVCLHEDDFRDLRKRCCSSETDYIASLSRCKRWDSKGGKSKSVFVKTLDDRFIVKERGKTEYESFVKFAPEYFKYMKDSYDQGNQTCLAKILGIHQVTVRQPKSGKEIRHNLMVMENLHFGIKVSTRQYNLKGSLHARFSATSANGAEDVLLDQNFVTDMNKSPVYVSETSKQNLQRAIYNDTAFLTSINVMDYSLLVGVDDESHELVCGIIGYFREYTWDKQIETWMKSSLVVPKNVQPTVISPIDYKTRFRKFMTTHFLCIPDKWCNPV